MLPVAEPISTPECVASLARTHWCLGYTLVHPICRKLNALRNIDVESSAISHWILELCLKN